MSDERYPMPPGGRPAYGGSGGSGAYQQPGSPQQPPRQPSEYSGEGGEPIYRPSHGQAYGAPTEQLPYGQRPSYNPAYGDPTERVPLPATAIPATSIPGSYPGDYPNWGADHNGWGSAPVAYPRPPEWRGLPVGPPPSKFRSIRKVVVAIVLFSMIPLLGLGAFVLVYNAHPAANDQAGPAKPPQVAGTIQPSEGVPSAPAAPPASPLNTQQIISKVSPAVVNITTRLGQQNVGKAGTGIVLTSDGLVLTNNHVISGGTQISAVDVGNGRTFKATVIGFDRAHDVAVIKLQNAKNLKKIDVADSAGVKVGDSIVAIGNAGGKGGTPTSVTGTVSGLDLTINAQDEEGQTTTRLTGMIEVQANIEAGDSGGPLVDNTGRLIGVNTAASVDEKDKANGGLGYAIPSNTALDIAKRIEDGKGEGTSHAGETALLGVGAKDAKGGAEVTGLLDGGPADKAGIQKGDVITSFDGNKVTSANDLTKFIDQHKPGDKVQVRWVDSDGNDHNAEVTLVTGPAG